jgi:hypothetical protein
MMMVLSVAAVAAVAATLHICVIYNKSIVLFEFLNK